MYWENVRDGLFFIFILLALITAILSFIFFGVNWWAEYRCGKYQDMTGTKTEWVFMDECYVKPSKESMWQVWDEYIAKSTAENLK